VYLTAQKKILGLFILNEASSGVADAESKDIYSSKELGAAITN
jgi:hypothetical protein